MNTPQLPCQPAHKRIEEWLNSATHSIGALLSVIGTIALIIGATQLHDTWKIVSFSIFGASLILLYMASALYHGARDRKSTRLNSSHVRISYAVFCLKK